MAYGVVTVNSVRRGEDKMDYIESELKYREWEGGYEGQKSQGGNAFSMAQKIAALFYRIKKIRRIQNDMTTKCREYEAKIEKARENASLYLRKIKALEEETKSYRETREKITRAEGDRRDYIKRCEYLEKKNARLAAKKRNIAQKLRDEKEKAKEMGCQHEEQKADMKAADPEKWNALLILKKGIEQRNNIIRNLRKNKGLSSG